LSFFNQAMNYEMRLYLLSQLNTSFRVNADDTWLYEPKLRMWDLCI